MTYYKVLKFIHIFGVVLFLGDIILVAVVKLLADRTRILPAQRFAQQFVLISDRVLLLPGIALMLIGGYVMAGTAHVPIWNGGFLLAQVLFFITGVVWASILVPTQKKQMRMLDKAVETGALDARYPALSRTWLIWGIVATVLPIGSLWLMVVR